MKTVRSMIVLVLILFPVLGCATHSVDSVNLEKPNVGERIPAAQSESSDGSPGNASPCSEPPESLVWGDKTYRLKEVGGQDLEPGMKLGYLECKDGVYTPHSEGENAVYSIYSFGSPLESSDLLYIGSWGRALYTPAESSGEQPLKAISTDLAHAADSAQASDSKEGRAEVTLKPPIRMMDASTKVEKDEVREIELTPELGKAIRTMKQPSQGLLETSLEARKADGKVDLRITLTNISGRDLSLHSGSGQRYDFHVLDEKGEEVYRWSYDKSFTAALVYFELKKSEQLEFEEVWMLQDNKGEPVPLGSYTIVAQVMAKPDSGEIHPEELTAMTAVELP